MRQFNEHETAVINKILVAKTGNTINVNEFIQSFLFSKDSKRAMILQAQSRYAVFFLAPELFDDAQKNGDEVKEFLELVALLSYLNKNGYITIYREKSEVLYFFQENFIGAKAINNTIVLNDQGDYTFAPDTIHDKNKKVIYKGIIFYTDIFELIFAASTGVMIVSDDLNNLIKNQNMETSIEPAANQFQKINKRIHKDLMLIFVMLSFLIHSALAFYNYVKSIDYTKQLTYINNNHKALKSSLDKDFADIKKSINSPVQKNTGDTEPLTHLYGVDLSKWNGDESTEIDPTDSISFIICKATEGTTVIDRDFGQNWNTIKDKHCILGAYHFFIADKDPIEQADHFWNTINARGKTDITPIVDIEQGSLAKNDLTTTAKVQANLLLFLDHLEKKCSRIPMIYTDEAFANHYLQNRIFSKYPLWLAEYSGSVKPKIPLAWKETGYRIWQKRDNYFIDSHCTDFDVFYGKKSDLYN